MEILSHVLYMFLLLRSLTGTPCTGVLFSSAMADNVMYCIIGYPSVQYTALHYG